MFEIFSRFIPEMPGGFMLYTFHIIPIYFALML
jgi:hypothetical protein